MESAPSVLCSTNRIRIRWCTHVKSIINWITGEVVIVVAKVFQMKLVFISVQFAHKTEMRVTKTSAICKDGINRYLVHTFCKSSIENLFFIIIRTLIQDLSQCHMCRLACNITRRGRKLYTIQQHLQLSVIYQLSINFINREHFLGHPVWVMPHKS